MQLNSESIYHGRDNILSAVDAYSDQIFSLSHSGKRELLSPSIETEIATDVLMRDHTSFRIGGPADYFASPATVAELMWIIRKAKADSIPFFLIGGGTNILVKDQGIRGLVISLSRMKNEIDIDDLDNEYSVVSVSAGTKLAALSRKTIKYGLKGFSFAAGIPGTVGGAIFMNAGTGIGTISDTLISIEILDDNCCIRTIGRSMLCFSHRKLDFSTDAGCKLPPVITGASFLLRKVGRECEEKSWFSLIDKRRSSQPHGIPSAGCFFRNPGGGLSAGAMIDQTGLKGLRVGNAVVSDKHANFLLNLGGATAADVISLSNEVKERVFEKFKVRLSEEVIIKGE